MRKKNNIKRGLFLLVCILFSNLLFSQNTTLDSLFTMHFNEIGNTNRFKVYIKCDNHIFTSNRNFGKKRVAKFTDQPVYPNSGNVMELWLASIDSVQFKDSVNGQFVHSIYYLSFGSEERRGNTWNNGEYFNYTVVCMSYFDQKYYFIFKEGLTSQLLYSIET